MKELVVSALGGFLAHQFRRVTERMPHGFRQLASYAIGVVFAFPFVCLFWKRLEGNKHRSAIAYLLGFLGFGTGIAGGWMIDTIGDE